MRGDGWTSITRTRISDGCEEDGYKLVQFVQLDEVQNVPGIEIAPNQVIDKPGKSRVEDNINIYLSGGTAASPILIHDNYIQGAYTINPAQGSYSNKTYSYDWVLQQVAASCWVTAAATSLEPGNWSCASLRQHRCFHSGTTQSRSRPVMMKHSMIIQ